MVRIEEVTVIKAPLKVCFDLARSIDLHVAINGPRCEEAVADFGGITSGLIGFGKP